MAEQSFPHLHGATFDVVVIGGGINGASVAQNLAAAGYTCLVVDKEDFGSGASGRSARMLHPGLRYFEARNPLRHFGLHPRRFIDALKGARQAMRSAGEHLQDGGERIQPYRMCFPIYRGDDFKSWHVSSAIKLLQLLGDKNVAFDFEMLKGQRGAKIPFFNDLRNTTELSAIACYNEFKFDWPERFCIDMLLDAESNGAQLQNYCQATLEKSLANGDWVVTFNSTQDANQLPAQVMAKRVVNMAGTWTDTVLPPDEQRENIVYATKGSHLVVELPDEYKGFGIAAMNRLGLPFYMLPLHKNYFSIGVTETPFSGDASDVYASDEDIDFLLAETNHLLPGLALQRSDVLRTWAGVRPLTVSPPMGSRTRKLHDLAEQGLPGVLALTSGPIMTHRESGRLVQEAIAKDLPASAAPKRMSYRPFSYSASAESPAFTEDEPDIREADIEQGAIGEQGRTLADILLRRTGMAWRRDLTPVEVNKAAQLVAPHLGWDNTQIEAQVIKYLDYQRRFFRKPDIDLSQSTKHSS